MVITVGKENADYSTVTEALQAIPYNEEAVIRIGKGVFREKIFCEKKNVTITGEGIGETVIEYGDGAFDEMPDGTKRGTFRSYTFFLAGEKAVVKNLTIRNIAGPGHKAGQAIALYADARRCYFENVSIEGYQDSLFMSPLPEKERQKNGFMGPRYLLPRDITRQYYKNCQVIGDVDFIFGGADAVFDECQITCRNRRLQEECECDDRKTLDTERFINGYITAPSGCVGGAGMIFRNCTVSGEDGCDKGSVFLGRPWRDEARVVFLNCTMDETIAPERYSGWGMVDKDEPIAFMGEYGNRLLCGQPCDMARKNPWVKELDERLYKSIDAVAERIVKDATN